MFMEYTDPFSLVSDTNELLDNIAKEKIDSEKFETKKLEEQKKKLEELREEMLRLGFDTPYKHLSEIQENLKSMRQSDPTIYKEELPSILGEWKMVAKSDFAKGFVNLSFKIPIEKRSGNKEN